MLGRIACAAAVPLVLAAAVQAAVYYVDFEGGADAADGLAPASPFKHCPGDPAATEKAAAAALEPGDTVIFKGGVAYRGAIDVIRPGKEGSPIVYDGNTAGTFGTGKAVVDGSEPLTAWRRCRSAEDCDGNPNWKNLYVAHVPAGARLFTVNLCEGERLLQVAQDPNFEDDFYNDDYDNTYRPVAAPVSVFSAVEIVPAKDMTLSPTYPLHKMIDGTEYPASVSPVEGTEVTLRLPEPATVQRFALTQRTGLQMVKDVVFIGDGKEILKATLKDGAGRQTLEMEKPATFKELTFKIVSAYPAPSKQTAYAKIHELEAFDAAGKNVLKSEGSGMAYADPDYFTQKDPNYWKGAYFVTVSGRNMMYYQKLLDYRPGEHKIVFKDLPKLPGPDARFAMYNGVGILDRAGEYHFSETPEADGTHRVILWPMSPGENGPQNITWSRREYGFRVACTGFVTIQGFRIQKQSGRGASGIAEAAGRTEALVIRNNDVTLVCAEERSAAIGLADISRGLIDGNRVSYNRRCAGIIVRRFDDGVVSNNLLHKNGSTAVDFYECRRSKLLRNTVTAHTGRHANGLTLYLGCTDCVVEGNRVFTTIRGLTIQDAENVVIRNNIFDCHGGPKGHAIPMCIWGGAPIKNLRIVNNCLLRSEWRCALFSNGRPQGLVVRNNIMDGYAGGLPGEFSHNIYTQWGSGQKDQKLGEGEIYEPDLEKLFINLAGGDYRLRPGSPAIDAGTDVGLAEDIVGTRVPQGRAPDIGAYEFTPPPAQGGK